MNENLWNGSEEVKVAAALGLKNAFFWHSDFESIDADHASRMVEEVRRVIEANPNGKILVLDLGKANYISAAGLAALNTIRSNMEPRNVETSPDGNVVLLDLQDEVKSILEMTNVLPSLEVRSSEITNSK